MIKEDISYKIIPRTVTNLEDNKIVEIADIIFEDYFYENDKLDKIYMGKKYIDWSYKHKQSANTYQLYIHCLNHKQQAQFPPHNNYSIYLQSNLIEQCRYLC